MTPTRLRGMGVALITPFKPDMSIDFDALANILEYQVLNGVDFLVVLGTTAETPALDADERRQLRAFVVDRIAGRVPLVIGIGGNCTAAVIQELTHEDLTGFCAVLSVVPFYNKPTQEGIYRHFSALAQASPLPLLLYNVPGRTGVNMTAATTLRLAADHPGRIIGIKEASGNIAQVDNILRHKPSDFIVLSGDDAITCPLLALGATGVISVIGNALTRDFSRMVHLALDNDLRAASALHSTFTDLYPLLFVDGNPAGIKCILHALGMIHNVLRLPLIPVRPETADCLRTHLHTLGLLPR